MDTLKIIARLRERAATQAASGGWSLDRTAAAELERLWVDCAALRARLGNIHTAFHAENELAALQRFIDEPVRPHEVTL